MSAVVWLRLCRGAAAGGAVAGAGTDASAGDVATPSAAALLQCQVLWQGGNTHEAKLHFSLDMYYCFFEQSKSIIKLGLRARAPRGRDARSSAGLRRGLWVMSYF